MTAVKVKNNSVPCDIKLDATGLMKRGTYDYTNMTNPYCVNFGTRKSVRGNVDKNDIFIPSNDGKHFEAYKRFLKQKQRKALNNATMTKVPALPAKNYTAKYNELKNIRAKRQDFAKEFCSIIAEEKQKLSELEEMIKEMTK